MSTDHLSHVDDPSTSNHAAVTLNPNTSDAIKHAIVSMLAVQPMTGDELITAYQVKAERNGWPLILDLHNVKRRLSELHTKHDLIEPTGERRDSAMGKPSSVWRLNKPEQVCHIIIGTTQRNGVA